MGVWIYADLTSFSEFACIAGGLLPQCQNCQKSRCQMCCHCIPAMPTDADSLCNVCNVAQWDDADPILSSSYCLLHDRHLCYAHSGHLSNKEESLFKHARTKDSQRCFTLRWKGEKSTSISFIHWLLMFSFLITLRLRCGVNCHR